jgi:L-alanine-DL-glutamate epimerase-like enolase superfamily enzyme
MVRNEAFIEKQVMYAIFWLEDPMGRDQFEDLHPITSY